MARGLVTRSKGLLKAEGEMGLRSAQSSTFNPRVGVLLVAVVLGATLGFGQLHGIDVSARPRTIGQDRVASWEALPAASMENDGLCEFVVASSSTSSSLAAPALPQQAGSGGVVASRASLSGAAAADIETRQPVRVITDPDYTFSAVAVDVERNEVILADQNNGNVVVYDRLENTPPTARSSEPKRIIAGNDTFLEFASSVYVDPANGDIYVINNDTMNWVPVFGREAQGNARPKRVLSTPHTTYGIAVNEPTREMFITVQDDHAVLVYDKNARSANGDPNRGAGGSRGSDIVESYPKRILQGSRTGLADPHGVAVDPVRDELFVSNWGTTNVRPTLEAAERSADERRRFPVSRDHAVPGSGTFGPASITVHPRDAKSDTAPIRTIRGPKTQLNWPTALAVHPERGELFVANDTTHSVLVFPIEANGDVAPIRVLKGAKSLIQNPIGVAVDVTNNELWVANFGNHSATVYPIDADGDPAPLRVIRSAPIDSPAPMLSNAYSAVFDSTRDEVLVANCVGHPSISAFPREANGSVNSVRSIGGQRTLISRTIHDMAYDPIHDEIVVPAWYTFGIITFRGSDNGDVAPTRIIYGPKTQIKNAEAVAVDPVHDEIFVPSMGPRRRDRVLVFRRTDNGDVAPIRILEGPDTGLSLGKVTVDPVNDLLIASGGNGLRIFDRTASGNTKPKAVIRGVGGSESRIRGTSLMTTYPPKGLIFTTRAGPGGRYESGDHIAVWSIHDDGDDPPRWEIGKDIFYDIRGITIDPESKTVMATDKKLNAIVSFYVPEIFDEPLENLRARR